MTRNLAITTAALAAGMMAAAPGAADGQTWRSMASSRMAQGEAQVDLRIEYGAGSIDVAQGSPGTLYGFELRYDEESARPIVEYDRGGGRLRLGMESIPGKSLSISRGSGRGAEASLKLSPNVPVALEMQFGAGEARLDLGDLSIRSADVTTGASETTLAFSAPNRVAADYVRIRSGAAALRTESLANSGAASFDVEGGIGETVLDFGGTWRRDAVVSVKLGMGALRLRFPRDVGVRLTRSAFLTRFDDGGLLRRGNEYYSANWDRAEHRLTVHITAAVGAIDVEWID